MAYDVKAIRTALATRLQTITYTDPAGLTVNLRAGNLADQINPPVALIGADEPFIDYDLVMARGADILHFKVLVLVGRVSERTAQDQLDYFLSTDHLKSALESSWPSTNPAVDYAEVKTVRGYGGYTIGDVEYLGMELQVEVAA